ncbi:L-Ala-D/L-Glu epimerase [Vibrio aquaticus]|uniref:Dipeptide epimerase n=1 Tax=Vibrio aquaticus TaxID=2496559 RepID=A0A432D3H7_9VIBR|nr:N-acetyl-D-Glu racemase DgcA [Vibrio aquaticus]RTZ18378.1 L-Ala-D/L-Glu epimerase [Vibrio aquaticus]
MKITAFPYSVELATPFVISRGARTHCNMVRVTIEHLDVQGLGECTPYPRYGESVESVTEQIELWQAELTAMTPEQAKHALQAKPAGAARNALDCALWDLIAKQQDADFPAPYFDVKASIETAMTVSIGSAVSMAQQAKSYVEQGATLLKVKLDAEDIIGRVTAVREAAPNTKIVLDANEAWLGLDLERIFNDLTPLNITMIEQPLPAGADDALKELAHPIPLCADESCHTRAKLNQLKDCYEMINIKLDKAGGLTEALLLEQQAREMGFSIMMGCMLGTSVAMKAALPIATNADVVDLDGPVLLGKDEVDGLNYHSGQLHLV